MSNMDGERDVGDMKENMDEENRRPYELKATVQGIDCGATGGVADTGAEGVIERGSGGAAGADFKGVIESGSAGSAGSAGGAGGAEGANGGGGATEEELKGGRRGGGCGRGGRAASW